MDKKVREDCGTSSLDGGWLLVVVHDSDRSNEATCGRSDDRHDSNKMEVEMVGVYP